MDQQRENVQESYDQVADEYVSRIFHELEHKPMDRELLDHFAQQMRGLGRVCDLGCGPGHVTRYFQERGVPTLGLDPSARTIELARQLNPASAFEQRGTSCPRVQHGAWSGSARSYCVL